MIFLRKFRLKYEEVFLVVVLEVYIKIFFVLCFIYNMNLRLISGMIILMWFFLECCRVLSRERERWIY